MNQTERDELVGLAQEIMAIASAMPRLDENTVDLQRIAGDILSISRHKRTGPGQTKLPE